MTEPTEAMKAMAARIAEEYDPDLHRVSADLENVALATIIQTQRADAELVERMAQSTQLIGGLHDWSLSFDERQMCSNIAQAIRTGNHYTKDESNGN